MEWSQFFSLCQSLKDILQGPIRASANAYRRFFNLSSTFDALDMPLLNYLLLFSQESSLSEHQSILGTYSKETVEKILPYRSPTASMEK